MCFSSGRPRGWTSSYQPSSNSPARREPQHPAGVVEQDVVLEEKVGTEMAEGGSVQRLGRADRLWAGAQLADRDLRNVSEQFVAVPADAADFAAIRNAEQ